jgi:hypothetical protein
MQAIAAPVVAVETADQITTAWALRKKLNENEGGARAVFIWDCVNGLRPFSKAAEAGFAAILEALPKGGPPGAAATRNPVVALVAITGDKVAKTGAPADSIVFMINAPLFLKDPSVLQAVMNLRDPFKSDNRVLVMFGADFKLPVELQADVFTFDDALPEEAEVGAIVEKLYTDQGVKHDAGIIAKSRDALRGLCGFAVEQAAAMAVREGGDAVDLESMWDRKKKQIEMTDGLHFTRPTQGFDVVGGCESIKAFFAGFYEKPRVIVLIDEMEKQLAGAGGEHSVGDSSGVSQDAHQTALKEMEDRGYVGVINYGIHGCTKSWIARAVAAHYGVPLVEMDFGAMRHGIVGESEAAVRRAFKVLHALGGDGHGVYFIATVNSLVTLSGPLQRRFCDGVYFFDLPNDPVERVSIGAIQAKLWSRDGYTIEDDAAFWASSETDGWSGANIRDCCRLAYRMRKPLREVAVRIVSTGKAKAELVRQLRADAHNRYFSAAKLGLYQSPDVAKADDAPDAEPVRTLKLKKS